MICHYCIAKATLCMVLFMCCGLLSVTQSAPAPRQPESRHDRLNPLKHPATSFYVNAEKPPGTLLLVMVIKNEAETLNRTLPRWATIIDFYVIGVDDHNEDTSVDVIKDCLRGIPGKIMTVTFDGMGPTYTKVIQRGWELFPEATHGIMADADYAPLHNFYDKNNLNIHASQQMFSLKSYGASRYRRLDWIYRNSPDVRVERRTHQIMVSPPLAEEGKLILPSNLELEETGPGYQDRTFSRSGKFHRYYELLLKDLEDYPNDPRTLYYLGDSCFGGYNAKVAEGIATAEDEIMLEEAHHWFEKRSAVDGFFEETYFALMNLGRINGIFWEQYSDALYYFKQAYQLDPHRADALMEITKLYLQRENYEKALIPLAKAADLPNPERTYMHHAEYYDCIAPSVYADYVKVVSKRGKLDEEELVRHIHRALKHVDMAIERCDIYGLQGYKEDVVTARAELDAYIREVKFKGYRARKEENVK